MKIDKHAVDDLSATLSIRIEKSDYEDKFKTELKKYAAKAQLKGFRKGKTPIAVVRKMYGQSVLAEVVNATLEEHLSTYIVSEKLNLLGQPLPSMDQEGDMDFDPVNLKDFTFKVDIGISPEFELQGVSKDDVHELFDVQIDDALVEEEIDFIKRRLGTQEEVEGAIEIKDILTIHAEELDGDAVKKDGWATEFTAMVDTLAKEYQDVLLKLQTGDTFDFDIYALEEGKEETYVQKYLLNLESDEDKEREIGRLFRGTVAGIKRLKEAAFDQELFDKYFPEGQVTSADDAKAKIKENIKSHYDKQAEQVMYRNIMDSLVENTEIPLPEEFLKRWVTESNKDVSPEDIEKDFEPFLKNLKWTLIKDKLSEQFEVNVEGSEVYAAMEQKVRGYFGQYGMGDEYLEQIMKNMMQNREEVNKTFEELKADKIFAKVGETVSRKKKKISVNDFNEFVKELNAKQQAS